MPTSSRPATRTWSPWPCPAPTRWPAPATCWPPTHWRICWPLTLGADGAWLLHRSGAACLAQEPQPPEVIDTVGAGDSFLAGLLAHLLRQAYAQTPATAGGGSKACPAAHRTIMQNCRLGGRHLQSMLIRSTGALRGQRGHGLSGSVLRGPAGQAKALAVSLEKRVGG